MTAPTGRRRTWLAAAAIVLSLSVATTIVEGSAAPHAAAAPSARPDRTVPDVRSLGPTAKKECVGSRFATLGSIYEAVFDSFLPILPAKVRADAPAIKARARADMRRLKVSTLAVSNHPYDMDAGDEDPMMRYRDPVSQYLVTQLVHVKEGRTAHAISVENLTLAQAVETVWLYLYITVMVPATIFRRSVPTLADLGPIGLGTLVSIPIMLGVVAATQLYKHLSVNLTLACVSSVTEQEKERAGKPEKDLRFAWAVPAIVRDIAGQISVADAKTCRHVGTLPLKRIVARTAGFIQATAPDARTKTRVGEIRRDLDLWMANTRLKHNWIPTDPADFSTAEYIVSQVSTMIPIVGGAPIEALIGLNRNRLDGLDFDETVPLSELTVSEGLTAAYYAYALTAHVIEVVWGNGGTDQAAAFMDDAFGATFDPKLVPRTTGLLTAPNYYGLVVYHNVLRSVCLDEDRTGPNSADKLHRPRRQGIVRW